MYIPKPALEDCLTSEISASGGDVMYDYITGSQIRRVHYFGWNTGSYELEIYNGCTDSTQLFMVGGGGSGGFIPSQSVAASGMTTIAGGMNGGAGGGGAGGVLFINPNRELTGSLALVPGKYPIYIGEGGLGGVNGSTDFNKQGFHTTGGDTTFRYAYRLANDADIPSGSVSESRYDYDSVFIKAGGGGFGSYAEWIINYDDECGQVGPWYQPRVFNAADGGSGGGAGDAADGTICTPYLGETGSVEFPFRNQGFHGNKGPVNEEWGGGGGAGGYSASSQPAAYYFGGDGVDEFARGFRDYFAQGGTGQDTPGANSSTNIQEPLTFVSASQKNFVKGVGGHGAISNIDITDYDLPNPPFNNGGWIDDLTYVSGTPGEVTITYALTGSQLTQGRLHYIDGGVDGGDFTFIPCGEVRLETLTVPAGKQACICAMDTGQPTFLGGRTKTGELWWREVELPVSSSDQYNFSPEKAMAQLPSGSGTVTFTTGSECNAYVEFEGWETCSACRQNSPAGIYIGFDISGSSGRTNPLPYYKYPDTTVHYTSSQNYITESRYNNHDSESYFETRIGAFSNDFDDDIPYINFVPSASFSTSYDDQNVDFTTGSECFTYYDCEPLTEQPITASGGDTGTYNSGSYVYKYHIFYPSGSSASTREFQEFTIADGYAPEFKMLVVGGGGPGGRATTSGTDVYGAGGGAGQVFLNPIPDICGDISMSISPGWGMPYAVGHEWTYTLANTIVSGSTFTLNALGGGQGGDNNQHPAELAAQYRSGSGGGGAGINKSVGTEWKAQNIPPYFAQTEGGNGWSGSLLFPTGAAGGGGGYSATGSFGEAGSTDGGRGGNGVELYLFGSSSYFAGGGGGYGPGGPGNGGLGGTNASLSGTASGSLGAGGGATDNSSTWISPWGTSYTGGGRGGDGAVIFTYRWKYNDTPDDYIAIRGLSQYYDMYDLNSYDGTGSLVYSLWKNEHTASLENDGGWLYDTDNLGSGSLLIQSASLRPYVEPEIEQSGQVSALTVWEVNNPVYDSDGLVPILVDEQFGTSSIGIYGGNDELYGEAVVIKVGDTIVTTQSGSAGEFIPRGGFHISQFSYNQGTNELLWYVDGYSGSAVVNETIDDKSILFSFNSSSAIVNPDENPVYPSPSYATEYTITGSDGVEYEFIFPQTGQIVSSSFDSSRTNAILASTEVPVITSGTATINSGSTLVEYYPSSSIYPGRTANYDWSRSYEGNDTTYWFLYYDRTNCVWKAETNNSTGTIDWNAAQNSVITYPSFDSSVTQVFTEFNDCIERPKVGLGNNSVYNVTAIYTASLDWDEMRHSDDFLYPRY
jgi:hypothetical protein